MNNTDKQLAFMNAWQTDQYKESRVKYLRNLFKKARLDTEFSIIDDIKLETMDPDKYMINVMALAKITQLANISENLIRG